MAEQQRRPSGRSPHRTAARRRGGKPRARQRRPPARWLAPALGVSAFGLLAASQLPPVLVDLTATSSAIPDEGVTVSSTSAPLGDGMLSWSTGGTVAGDSNGAGVPEGTTSSGFSVPQPPRPNGVTVQPWAAHGVPPTLTPLEPACGGYTSPKRITPGVVAGAGSATVTWRSDHREEVQSYQVSAVSQTLVAGAQPAPVTATAAQPAGCQQMTVTVTGLAPGQYYVFWLEEQVTSPSTGRVRLDQVGSSAAVLVG